MKSFKQINEETVYSFTAVKSPTDRTNNGLGPLKLSGIDPIDALKQSYTGYGFQNIDIKEIDGVFSVTANFKDNPSDKVKDYFRKYK